MDRAKLSVTIQSARIFIDRANKAYERLSTDSLVSISGSKETAACRRASMELTRALAKLRKP